MLAEDVKRDRGPRLDLVHENTHKPRDLDGYGGERFALVRRGLLKTIPGKRPHEPFFKAGRRPSDQPCGPRVAADQLANLFTGRPLKYRPTDTGRIVYSRARNLADDGGEAPPASPARGRGM